MSPSKSRKAIKASLGILNGIVKACPFQFPELMAIKAIEYQGTEKEVTLVIRVAGLLLNRIYQIHDLLPEEKLILFSREVSRVVESLHRGNIPK